MTIAAQMPQDALDQSRAENWDVLALLLSAPPGPEVLALLAGLDAQPGAGDPARHGPLAEAWRALAQAAARSDAETVAREYFALFVGVGRGELLPYASFYLTGFLNERPLAELRADLARLGIARQPGDHDPEDRIALLCAVMAAYARGDFAAGVAGSAGSAGDAPDQARFFARHLAPWAGLFFDDLAQAPAARFYAALAQVGRAFIAIENKAFALDAQEKTIA